MGAYGDWANATHEFCIDCALKHGPACTALASTTFPNNICPFHKTEAELIASRTKAAERLRRLGLKIYGKY